MGRKTGRLFSRAGDVIRATPVTRQGPTAPVATFEGLAEQHPISMSLAPARGSEGGGAISFQGLVRDSSTVTRMEHSLRDRYHRVQSPTVRQREQGGDYPWHFGASMGVLKRGKGQYTMHLPPPSQQQQAAADRAASVADVPKTDSRE